MEKMLKNIESMAPEEREKLRRLLNQDKQKDGETMDWMYKQSKPEDEDYLLGRRVDKYIEEEGKVEEDPNAPGATFAESLARRADMDMQAKMREDPLYAIKQREEDAKRKLLSNPIKMKQLEKLIQEKERKSKKKQKKKKKKRKDSSGSDSSGDELLMKYLEIRKQKEMKALRKTSESEAQPTGAKEKQQRSFRKRHSSESSDEPDHKQSRPVSGSKVYGLVSKHSQHKQRSPEQSKKTSKPRRSRSDSPRRTRIQKSKRSSSRSRSPLKSKGSKQRNSQSHSPRRKKNDSRRSRSPQRSHRRQKSRSPQRSRRRLDPPRSPQRNHRRSDSRSPQRNRRRSDSRSPQRSRRRSDSKPPQRSRRRSDSRSPQRSRRKSDSRSPQRILRRPDSRSPQRSRRRSDSRSPQRDRKRKDSRSPIKKKRKSSPQPSHRDSKPKKEGKQKLSSEEMARRRAEMLENAQWRDKQREENVKRYTEEAQREKEEMDSQTSAGSFLNPMMMKHAAQSSVEDRIKRNKYNVQRTNADLDKNFARK